MGSFRIEGGCKLRREIVPQGAKNEAMQIIGASLLTDEEVVIENLPNILDINNLIDLLKCMGVKVVRNTPDVVSLQAKDIDFDYFEKELPYPEMPAHAHYEEGHGHGHGGDNAGGGIIVSE